MGLFDIFKGSTPAEKAQKLKKKVTEKYGEAAARQKAIEELVQTSSPDVVPVLMQRFTLLVDPQTTDADEKRMVFDAIVAQGEPAVANVVDFLKKSEAASSWAVKILAAILPEEKVVAIVTDELRRLGVEYTRDPEKKEVLLHFLDGKHDPQIGDVALALLKDMSDDVKIAALRTLGTVKDPRAREPVLELLVHDETARRVQTRCVEFLHETGLEVQGFREKVEKRLAEPYFLDKSGAVKKRGG
ncbi:MAG: HEAT repeat domain-containing protein [Myxococcaceae bacterium]|nr:HEAT repeat domain-containing protein [Myxococcaceae bacterium]